MTIPVFTLPDPHIPEKGGFTSENDIFGYREFAERLANLVSNVKEPLVILLDGPWGSGKSVFIKQWAGLIRDRGGEVVYFDAFENDFYSDAFLALAAEIYSTAKEKLGENNLSTEDFLCKAQKIGEVITSRGLDIVLRHSTSGIVNLKGIEAVIKASKDESKKVILEKLQKADEERKSLEAFRNSLSDVSKSINKKKRQGTDQPLPLVFVVDELDRCRPPFSLDIIEHIKHFFFVKNICFVLVTNLSQMKAIIKNTYGSETGTDAEEYLEKFYQLKIMLPELDFYDRGRRDRYLDYLWDNLHLKFGVREPVQIVLREIKHLANAHALSLRQMEHVMRNIVLIASYSNKIELRNSAVTAGLCVMRQTDSELYAKARENSLHWDDVKDFLKIDSNDRNHVVGNWKYLTDSGDMSEEIVEQYSRQWQSYSPYQPLPKGRLLQSLLTHEIDSLLGSQSSE